MNANTNANPNTVAWGIEIETTMPNGAVQVGGYHAGRPVEWLPCRTTHWKAERDGSIRPTTLQRTGCEFVSPILWGHDEGLREVEKAVEQIKARGGRVNPTCGIHITIQWRGDDHALARLISLVANHEKAIYASTGTRRRETGTYTKSVKRWGCHTQAESAAKMDRYHGLNLKHLARGHNRIEFRFFAGSLNIEKIRGYIQICLGLVELALTATRKSKWDYNRPANKKSCWDRNGAGMGETELNRLFYRLGWTKGWYKGEMKNHAFGRLHGMSDDKMRATKKVLLAMAKKYDAT